MRINPTTVMMTTCSAILVAAAPATAQETSDSFQRPAYKLLRFQEDWSGLKGLDLSGTGDCWDPIKYVPLSDDGDIWASFGGRTRLRVESWNDFGFGATANNDDTFAIWRLLMHGDVHFGSNVRAFIEGKSALSTDRDLPGGQRSSDVDSIDLEQAFVDLKFQLGDEATLTLRPGRQQFLFGKQRLVSPLPWANTFRRWDGISAILQVESWNIHGFWSQFVPAQKYDFNTADAQTQFYGVYATTKLADAGLGLDLYFLGLDRDDPVTFNGTTGSEMRYTAGGRLSGNLGDSGFAFDFEGAYQFGEVGSSDISAFMIGSELAYAFKDARTKPRLFVGFDYGSGDDKAGGDVETFNHLFPLGHAYLGYIDAIGRQNIIDVNFGGTCTPCDRTTVTLTGHLFYRDSTNDALYNAGGGVARAGGLGSSREVGSEIDLTVKYTFDEHLTGLFGYSHFFAGDFIEESGSSSDIDFIYAQLEYTF